jgi:hypothetical protein
MKCNCRRLRFKILAKNKGETNGPASTRKLLLVKCRDCRRQYVCTANPRVEGMALFDLLEPNRQYVCTANQTESGLVRPGTKIGKAVNGYIQSAVAEGSLSLHSRDARRSQAG